MIKQELLVNHSRKLAQKSLERRPNTIGSTHFFHKQIQILFSLLAPQITRPFTITLIKNLFSTLIKTKPYVSFAHDIQLLLLQSMIFRFGNQIAAYLIPQY